MQYIENQIAVKFNELFDVDEWTYFFDELEEGKNKLNNLKLEVNNFLIADSKKKDEILIEVFLHRYYLLGKKEKEILNRYGVNEKLKEFSASYRNREYKDVTELIIESVKNFEKQAQRDIFCTLYPILYFSKNVKKELKQNLNCTIDDFKFEVKVFCPVCSKQTTFWTGKSFNMNTYSKSKLTYLKNFLQCPSCGHACGGFVERNCECGFCQQYNNMATYLLKILAKKINNLIFDNLQLESIEKKIGEYNANLSDDWQLNCINHGPSLNSLAKKYYKHAYSLTKKERMFIDLYKNIPFSPPNNNEHKYEHSAEHKHIVDLKESFPQEINLKSLKEKGVIFEKEIMKPIIISSEDLKIKIMKTIPFFSMFISYYAIESECKLKTKRWCKGGETIEDPEKLFEFLNYMDTNLATHFFDICIEYKPVSDEQEFILEIPTYEELCINPYFVNDSYRDGETENNGSILEMKTVFNSPYEKNEFQTIQSEFPNCIVMPNYPLWQFVDFRTLAEYSFSKSEIEYLKKANVDFLIADKQGHPVKAIELQIGKHHCKTEYQKKDNIKLKLFDHIGLPIKEILVDYNPQYFM